MAALHDEIWQILHKGGKARALTLREVAQRCTLTRHQTRVGRALRDMCDEGRVAWLPNGCYEPSGRRC